MGKTTGESFDLLGTVSRYIDQNALIAEGAGVVLGVSGGPDSVALLESLHRLAGQKYWRLCVAHLDHGLRSESADDARWVEDLARGRGLEFHTRRVEIRRVAAQEGVGVEEASRRRRYAFLREVAGLCGADAVAVAHHQGDQVETILQRLFRGTHLRGLAGMRPRRRLRAGVLLVRPLLCVTREQIVRWLSGLGRSWLEDPSNAQTCYDRNFIRHELLPLLRGRLNPRVDDALVRLGRAAGGSDRFLRAEARKRLARATISAGDEELVLSAQRLARDDPALLGVSLRLMLERLGKGLKDVSAEHFARLEELIRRSDAKAIVLPGNVHARRSGGQLILRTGSDTAQGAPADPPTRLEVPGRTRWGGFVIECQVLKADDPRALPGWKPEGMSSEVMDLDSIRGGLVVRARQLGDAFVPLGAPGTQKVGDFLTNVKASPRLRRRVFCVCDAEGLVFLSPFRIADRVRLGPSTRKVLRLVVR